MPHRKSTAAGKCYLFDILTVLMRRVLAFDEDWFLLKAYGFCSQVADFG
jgi:hypothetical protein